MELKCEIKNPKAVLKAGDTIEGVISIRNPDTDKKGAVKKQKMKFVQISFVERVPVKDDETGVFKVFLDGSREEFKGKPITKEIDLNEWKDFEFDTNDFVSKPFNVKMPGGYKSNRGHQTPSYDWYVIMCIREKTGMIGTPKWTRIIPIENSDRGATWLD